MSTTIYHLYDELSFWVDRLRELDMEQALIQQRGIRTRTHHEHAEMVQILKAQASEAIAGIQAKLRSV